MDETIVNLISVETILEQVKQILEEELDKNPSSNEPIRIDLSNLRISH